MGRRSRRRASAAPRERTTAPAPPAPSPARAEAPLSTASRRARRDAAPKPPWGSFPLVELCALAAIVLGVWGILGGRLPLVFAAMLLGSIAGLEVAIREHLGGYRSHTLVLSGVVAITVMAILYFAGAQRTLLIAGAGGGLLVGVPTFRQLFKRKSGGVGMKVR
ncbi:MAG TPA: hypothetical protein VN635_14585 [Conexibacter sp.]|nr:hypothetical protein [Conexibacter sp.]